MQSGKFFVYLNIAPLPAAWAAYRATMHSASSIGTDSFRPIAIWPYGLMKRAASGDQHGLMRLEKEIAAEQVRRTHYPHQVSRLHGIYLWGSEDDAIRCEPKWRENEGQHFDRDRLVEVAFSYTNLTRVDTQWIDLFVINDSVPLERNDLTWAHRYWKGDPWDANPHWEILIEGRGLLWGTQLRTKALQRVEANWPHLMGQLELSRLAAEMGSDLNSIAPFMFQQLPSSVRVDFCMDVRDQNDAFMTKVAEHLKTLDRSAVNWKALEILRSDQTTPDLRQEGFEFDLNLLSEQGRAGFPAIVSRRNTVKWGGPTGVIAP